MTIVFTVEIENADGENQYFEVADSQDTGIALLRRYFVDDEEDDVVKAAKWVPELKQWTKRGDVWTFDTTTLKDADAPEYLLAIKRWPLYTKADV